MKDCVHQFKMIANSTDAWDEEFRQYWCITCGCLKQTWGTDGRITQQKYFHPIPKREGALG